VDTSEFRGTIGRYWWESRPWWPDPPRPPSGAPNVLMIVLDDVGFAQIGCFGSDIETPVLDGLAAGGLRYSNFHTTSLCSPTRACLLTGRNHHANGMGRIIELAVGYPGYDSRIPKTNAFLSEMLEPHGYGSYAVGKWHLTPDEECHLGASRARWPLGRGFQRFYGFFSGETHQFAPAIVHDNHFADPPRRDGYHLTEDLVDRAIEFLTDLRHVDPAKPFFTYFCTGACHAPHQVHREWIERYRGRFDRGWDAWREEALARQIESGLLPQHTRLSERPEWVPAWDALSVNERRVYARFMEVYAGFLSHTDHHLGRLLSFLEQTGDLENTLIFVLSDNGASSEGGPTGSVNDLRLWNFSSTRIEEALEHLDEIGGPRFHNNYPWGWTVAGNTPFRRWKREVHEGGVADPLIVHWPGGTRARGEVRRQYVHAIDLLPTALATAGIEPPAEIDGVSFAHTFDDASAATRREMQYYEMFGCRALYENGWKAVSFHPIQDPRQTFDEDRWELYDVEADPSETNDLAAVEPERLASMIERWWDEAERNQVLPLDNRPLSDLTLDRPTGIPPRERYEYYPGGGLVPETVAVNVRNRSHTITAEVEIPDGDCDGVLVSMGSVTGGWSLYVHERRLHYVHNFVGLEVHRIAAPDPLAPGLRTLSFHFEKTAEHQGNGILLVDGKQVARGEIPRFTPTRFSITGHGLTCGRGGALALVDDFSGSHPFAGRLIRVVIDVDGAPYIDPEGEARVAVTTQ
jgi:arylsulfatase A-like enzyme